MSNSNSRMRNEGVGDSWTPCMICQECVELFIKDMMPTYLKNLIEADCRASQLRVLAQGPPIYVKVRACSRAMKSRTILYSLVRRESTLTDYGIPAQTRRSPQRWMYK